MTEKQPHKSFSLLPLLTSLTGIARTLEEKSCIKDIGFPPHRNQNQIQYPEVPSKQPANTSASDSAIFTMYFNFNSIACATVALLSFQAAALSINGEDLEPHCWMDRWATQCTWIHSAD
ncbi:hypothetical protein EAE99_000769 [Botrytis elliptica]|nr:hypothetical protein EAE99_000769 [Botrytis elliptica]